MTEKSCRVVLTLLQIICWINITDSPWLVIQTNERIDDVGTKITGNIFDVIIHGSLAVISPCWEVTYYFPGNLNISRCDTVGCQTEGEDEDLVERTHFLDRWDAVSWGEKSWRLKVKVEELEWGGWSWCSSWWRYEESEEKKIRSGCNQLLVCVPHPLSSHQVFISCLPVSSCPKELNETKMISQVSNYEKILIWWSKLIQRKKLVSEPRAKKMRNDSSGASTLLFLSSPPFPLLIPTQHFYFQVSLETINRLPIIMSMMMCHD